VWGLVHITFGIQPLLNTNHLFGTWCNILGGSFKRHLLVGASAFCLAIWLSRKDIVFDKAPTKTFLQVLYQGMHWLQFWSQLEKNDHTKALICGAYAKLEIVAMQLFIDHG
jgi:hypothetical protein